jgi:hypothetical protein
VACENGDLEAVKILVRQ